MAKNDNLKDFLTDVADAIRAKKGTSAAINPQDFSAEIASIETAGGGGGAAVAVAPNDVNFRDYDGTILHSYNKEKFLALANLPSLPTQVGLICQEWNWDLADAQDYVRNNGKLEIGATYITDDGKTRLYIRIPDNAKKNITLRVSQTIPYGVVVDWGDGRESSLAGTGNSVFTHEYAAPGGYMITLTPQDECIINLGANSSSYSVMGGVSGEGKIYCSMLYKVELGKNITALGKYAFSQCGVKTVTVPNSVTSIDSAFYFCYALDGVVIPKGAKSIPDYAFNYSYGLTFLSVPKGVTAVGRDAFKSCKALSSVTMPEDVAIIGSYSFYDCNNLGLLVFSPNVKAIPSYAFYGCSSIVKLRFGDIDSIAANAFQNCSAITLDFSRSTKVPTLANVNAFNSTAYRTIIVPDALYEDWIAASNWSSLSSSIIKASEYTE